MFKAPCLQTRSLRVLFTLDLYTCLYLAFLRTPMNTNSIRPRSQSTKGSIIRPDAILPMQEPHSGVKNYEFRTYLINCNVERIWFYRTAPHSSIEIHL